MFCFWLVCTEYFPCKMTNKQFSSMFDISMQRGVLSGSESLVVQFRRLQNTLFILAIPILYDLEIAAATFSRAVDSLCHGN